MRELAKDVCAGLMIFVMAAGIVGATLMIFVGIPIWLLAWNIPLAIVVPIYGMMVGIILLIWYAYDFGKNVRNSR